MTINKRDLAVDIIEAILDDGAISSDEVVDIIKTVLDPSLHEWAARVIEDVGGMRRRKMLLHEEEQRLDYLKGVIRGSRMERREIWRTARRRHKEG